MPTHENDFRQRHKLPVDRPLALFVGRVAHEKNLHFLLQAMQHALTLRPELALVIAGEGPALNSLKKAAAQMGIAKDVFFLGYLDRKQELPLCYAAADLFVFSSLTETQGLVLLEAMAAGLPVLGIPAMGAADILKPQRGAVCAPEGSAGIRQSDGRIAGRHESPCQTLRRGARIRPDMGRTRTRPPACPPLPPDRATMNHPAPPQPPHSESPFKGKTGLTRVWNAFNYSLAGLAAAWKNEDAFRQEVLLAALLIPTALFCPVSPVEKAIMIASVLLVIIVELLNSAVEAAIDRISLDRHLLSKRAKDVGSAAVLIALLNVAIVWGLILVPLL